MEDFLIKIAQDIFSREAKASGRTFNLSELKVFKFIQQDLDCDGQEEICFAAGISSHTWGEGICCLIDFQNDSYQVIKLVPVPKGFRQEGTIPPVSAGFRDLQILDLNHDGILEIVTWWQNASGAWSSLYIFQWNGKDLISLFPEMTFHQGFFERKDLDADGVDEIIVWEGLWEEGAQWEPQRFKIYVFRYNDCKYKLQFTKTSEKRYNPASIISRETIFGSHPQGRHRLTPLDSYQKKLATLIKEKQVNNDFLNELEKHWFILFQETFYEESLSIVELALEATNYLSSLTDKAYWSISLWIDKGVTFLTLGNYVSAEKCYLKAFSLWIDELNERVPAYCLPAYQRDLGNIYLAMGNYEHALTYLSKARTVLEKLETSVPENQKELSRLYSILGLAHFHLGEFQTAITLLEQANALDKSRGDNYSLLTNHTTIGNIQRSHQKYKEAIESYQAALVKIDEVFHRDIESNVYLELGLTLVINGQQEQGLQYLQKALLLTSLGNLKQREATHYLYIGEAYRELNQLKLALRFFKKAIAFAEDLKTPQTKWKAFYGLALTYQRQEKTRACHQALEAAIETIEQLRSQYLPETLKISLFADKVKPYEAMILLSHPTNPKQAFNYIEQAKSRIFIEQLATTGMGSAAGIPLELTQQEEQLIREIRNLQLRHRETLSQQKYEWGNEIAKIEGQLEQLWHDIGSTGNKGSEFVALRKAMPLNFAGLKHLLNYV